MTKEAIYQRETREFCKKIGICQRCHKKKAAINLTLCPECLEKMALETAARRNNEEFREKRRERDRKRYAYRLEHGICVYCGKPATHGRTCYECKLRMARYSQKSNQRKKRERQEKGLKSEIWAKEGRCIRCGAETISGKKMCKKHYEMAISALEKGRKAQREKMGYVEDFKRRTGTA